MGFYLCPICNQRHSKPCSWMLSVGFIPTAEQVAEIEAQAMKAANTPKDEPND